MTSALFTDRTRSSQLHRWTFDPSYNGIALKGAKLVKRSSSFSLLFLSNIFSFHPNLHTSILFIIKRLLKMPGISGQKSFEAVANWMIWLLLNRKSLGIWTLAMWNKLRKLWSHLCMWIILARLECQFYQHNNNIGPVFTLHCI